MATYDYQCVVCGETQEMKHRMVESPEYDHCGKKMKKLIVTKGAQVTKFWEGNLYEDTLHRPKSQMSWR